jgi:hypothetical protein
MMLLGGTFHAGASRPGLAAQDARGCGAGSACAGGTAATAVRGREGAGALPLIDWEYVGCRMRSLQAALRHHLQHVPQTELEPQDPLFSSPIANSHSAQHASMAD